MWIKRHEFKYTDVEDKYMAFPDMHAVRFFGILEDIDLNSLSTQSRGGDDLRKVFSNV